ncbi:GM11806 [Drosophila sechellia]|uniref:GM11806 n=2 Tax=Drosophila sechellia TaxID=7238 RepID=B4IH63_DROSE|nr:GM11806 [Drosophila sechellia]
MDFQQLQGNLDPESSINDLVELNKDSKRQTEAKSQDNSIGQMDPRAVRSLQDPKDLELKKIFQTLFSSNDKTACEEIKSKLGVSWDMNSLKTSARMGAKKYLEKFNSKRNKGMSLLPIESSDGTLTNDAFSNFSSFIPHALEKKSNDSVRKTTISKPTFLKGVAKILSNPEIRYRDWDSKPAQEIPSKAAGT